MSSCCLAMESWLKENLITLEINLGNFQQRLIFRHLAFGLLQLHLERARIDFRQKISSADHLAFAKQDLHDLAIDTAFHSNCVERGHRAQSGQIDVHFAGLGFRGYDWNVTGDSLPLLGAL